MLKKTKKDDGSFMSMASIIMTILFVGLLLIAFTSWMSNINRKTELDSIARKYMLAMETTGYLTNSQEQAMTIELEEAGLNNVIYTGSTMVKQSYGSEITLSITGDMKMYIFASSGFENDSRIGTSRIHIEHSSTSKK